ncbi:MAG: tRNA-(ms[2]io[6]A)-hydroxylase [Deltaproteobacteria bacterium]|nr:tRNA-(ms[2]io[6]A)-hydroxylase [Deltaproteobacteria bacterium]
MRLEKTRLDEAWLAAALSDPLALLSDHAHCEKKAAASAMGLVNRHPEETALVTAMVALAREELEHFADVHAALVARGGTLGPDLGDPYVQALLGEVRSGGALDRLVDRLLCSALIEARSFERLWLLAERHPDPDLRELYDRFARAEARHGTVFVQLARDLVTARGGAREDVDQRLAELTRRELAIIESHPIRCAIH